jgi:AcrR family transcriptional regulator
MVSRQKLLDAAVRIYSEAGFRGATTRRIAEEAGVNEVTLFRLFGSKSALIAEALRQHAPASSPEVLLPEVPVDPEEELTAWCDAQLAHLRAARSLIRKAMGELEEHPEMAPCMSQGPTCSFYALRAYAIALVSDRRGTSSREASAAAAMLMGALFADAMGREMFAEVYPQPPSSAGAMYARIFLRALGCDAATPRPRDRSSRRPTKVSL